jgi:CheY-like chemotaxis protein
MDVHMPVMDGLQATAALRVAPGPNQRVQVIAVTASVHPEERARCAAAGMDAFLPKPLTVPVLAEALSAALDRAGRGGG